MLGYVEDFVLTYKLLYNNKRIVADFAGRDEFLEFVFGSNDLSRIDRLAIEYFDEFVVSGSFELMNKLIDEGTLTIHQNRATKLDEYRDKFESALFPQIAGIVKAKETIQPLFAKAVQALISQEPSGLEQKEKEALVLEKLLALTEGDLIKLTNMPVVFPLFSWQCSSAINSILPYLLTK